MNLEQVLPGEYERLSALAPDPDRVRAGLPTAIARAARRRRRLGGLAAVGVVAAVAAAVTVPVVTLGRNADRGTVAQTPAGPAVPAHRVPLRYSPTTMPPRFVERSRRFERYGRFSQFTRHWSAPDPGPPDSARVPPTVTLDYFSPGDPRAKILDGEEVPIGDRRGILHGLGSASSMILTWQVDADTVLQLSTGGAVDRAGILAIARSVRPDPGYAEYTLRVGWLPAGVSAQISYLRADSPRSWYEQAFAIPAKGHPLEITVGTAPPTRDGGRPTTVGARPAWLFAPDTIHPVSAAGSGHALVVALDDGLYLTVATLDGSAFTGDDFVRIAESVDFARPELGWAKG